MKLSAVKLSTTLAALVVSMTLTGLARADTVSFTTLVSSEEKGLVSAGRTVIDTEIGYLGFMAMRGLLDNLPAFDHRKEMAVAFDLGRKSEAGWAVSVTEVATKGGRIAVSYAIKKPGPGAEQRATNPWCLVKFARQEGITSTILNVDFVDVTDGAPGLHRGVPSGRPESLPFKVIVDSATSNLTAPAQTILATEPRYVGFMVARSIDPMPAFDPKKDVVVAIAAGTKPTGGYSIKVTDVALIDSKVLVTYEIVAPGPNVKVAKVPTSPFVVVRFSRQEGVPTTSAGIRFKELTKPKPPTLPIVVLHPTTPAPAPAPASAPTVTPGITKKIQAP